MPAVPDWNDEHFRALEQARALIVICTPGSAKELTHRKDWLYHEIRWWVENRSPTAPILIAPYGNDWLPDPISAKWPNLQLVNVSSTTGQWGKKVRADLTQRLLRSIALISASGNTGGSSQPATNQGSEDGMLNTPSLYTWEKDKHFRYIRCNENYARIAGQDSPAAMIGKTDDDMPWRGLANFFRAGDQQVISGTAPREHVTEQEIAVDGAMDILVSENQMLNSRGECLGLSGYFVDITGHQLVPRDSSLTEAASLSLGKEFGNAHLSEVEGRVLKGMLSAHSEQKMASILNISRGEVESHIRSIKLKLQCSTEGDVIVAAMRAGLPLALFGPRIIGQA
jgi:DNA-binding CsgD family transcriptional regulator